MAKMAIVKMPLIQLQTNGTSYKAKDETTEKLPTCHQTSKPNVSSLPTTPILSCKKCLHSAMEDEDSMDGDDLMLRDIDKIGMSILL